MYGNINAILLKACKENCITNKTANKILPGESIEYSASSSNKETPFSKHKTEKRRHEPKYLVSKRSAISKYNFLL